MEFVFLGQKIVLNDDVEKYVEILKGYYEVASDFHNQLERNYSSAGNMTNVLKVIRENSKKYYNSLIDTTIELLRVNEKITNVDSNIISKYYQKIIGIGCLESELQWFDDILIKKPELNHFMYKDSGTWYLIKNIIKNDALRMVNVYIDITIEQKGYFKGKSSDDTMQKVNSIIEKIENTTLKKNEIANMLCECIRLHAFNESIYYHAIKNFGDENLEISQIAKNFFVDSDYIKNDLMEPIIEEAEMKIDEDLTLEELIALKNELKSAERFYGFSVEKNVQLAELYHDIDEYIEEYEDDTELLEADNKENYTEKTFQFLGYTVTVSKEQILYKQIIDTYHKRAVEQSAKLRERYTNAGELDAVIKNIEDWGADLLSETVRIMLSEIGQLGIYFIDMKIVNQKYAHLIEVSTWKSQIEKLAEKYAACVYSEEQMKMYRSQRKEQRGKFVGGGFGISGAIKGSIQASALNMTTGAIHSVVNVIGNMASDARISANKRSLYLKKSTIDDLCNVFYDVIRSVNNIYIQILRDEKNIQICIPERSSIERADAINNNIKAGRCLQQDMARALVESVSLNMYNKETYMLAIQYFGDADNTIANMAKFFFVDSDRIKEEMMIKFFRSMEYDMDSLDTPKDISSWEARKKKIREKETWMGYSSVHSQKVYDFIDKGIEVASNRLRIANGKYYETKEIAEIIKSDLVKIYKIVDKINSEEEQKRNVAELNLQSEEISDKRYAILERAHKLKSGDIDEIDAEISKIKLEVVELPHERDKDSRYAAIIEDYLEDRYFDTRNTKYDIVSKKIQKVISLEKDEKILIYIAMLQGIMFNDVGVVITNKKVYFVKYKDVLFESEWNLIDKILVEKGKYMIYTKDSKFFTHEMKDIGAEYICNIMNEYFERVVSVFSYIYTNNDSNIEVFEKSKIDKIKIDKSSIVECYLPFAQEVWSHTSTMGFGYGSECNIVHFYGEEGFEERIESIKMYIGNTLANEFPVLYCEADYDKYNSMLITNNKIYWFNNTGFNKSMTWDNVSKLFAKRKGLFMKPFVEFRDGTIEQMSVASIYASFTNEYVEMLNLAKEIVKKINEIIDNS